MRPLVEQAPLPHSVEQGPQRGFLGTLIRFLATYLTEMAYRINKTAPKDGSELQQMVSYDSMSFPTVSADVHDADVGYYTVAKFTLTGSDHSLTGIANGAGQEGAGGRVLWLVNITGSALNLLVQHDNAGSLVANRILLPHGTVALMPNSAVQLWYDLSALRWRLV